MVYLKIALRNLLRHPLRSLVLFILLFFLVFLVFCGLSLIDTSRLGLEKTFIGNMTGEWGIRTSHGEDFSLFGLEIPGLQGFSQQPPIEGFAELRAWLDHRPDVEKFQPQLSSYALVEVDRQKFPLLFFGVDAKEYFSFFPDLKVLRGDSRPSELLAGPGVLLNEKRAADLEKSLGRELVLGEELLLTVYLDDGFRLVARPFKGVIRYSQEQEALEQVNFCDAEALRVLNRFTLRQQTVGTSENLALDDIDSLFDTMSDTGEGSPKGDFDLSALERNLADTELRDALNQSDPEAWQFLLFNLKEGASPESFRRDFESFLAESGLNLELVGWEKLAGSSVLILGTLQAIFTLGLSLMVLTVVIISGSILAASVLQRQEELSGMRALGASKGFLLLLLLTEVLLLSLLGIGFGTLSGRIFLGLLSQARLPFENSLLSSLFASPWFVSESRPSTWLLSFLLGLLVGLGASLYPLRQALRLKPALGLQVQ